MFSLEEDSNIISGIEKYNYGYRAEKTILIHFRLSGLSIYCPPLPYIYLGCSSGCRHCEQNFR